MNRKIAAVLSAYVIIALMLSGCFSKKEPARIGSGTIPPQSYQNKPAPSATPTPAPSATRKDLQISSPTNSPGAASSAKSEKKGDTDKTGRPEEQNSTKKPDDKPAKPDYNITSPFSLDQPTLMGFTVNDRQKDVVQRFGTPPHTFKMDDSDAPLSVFEYPGFSIGFNKLKEIVFVEVNSSSINPGLNGFRLGQTTEEALKALGKPDSNTDYALSYISGGVMLKLDVDPKTEAVTSIKLFASDGK